MAVETTEAREAINGWRPRPLSVAAPPLTQVQLDGKYFKSGGERFQFRGVTYGTFAERGDGALFPESRQLRSDLEAISAAGFTVVRTYTPPPPDMIDAAGELGLRILSGIDYRDWRYLFGSSVADSKAVRREAHDAAITFARSVAGNPVILGISVGNEVPADVIRWIGTKPVSRLLAELCAQIHDVDPQRLVTYANYPTAEYLHGDDSDFVTFNVFLESRQAFHRYLTRLQHAAAGRPLVLGEIGLDSGADARGEARQAEVLDWQLEVAMERGIAGCCVFSWTDSWTVGGRPVGDWHFGLTRRNRSPKPALKVAQAWNCRAVSDLKSKWPSISVVICAHNAEATLDECLRHTSSLDYPHLEILVVDDGSTDATGEIARRHPRARLVSIPHSGLGAARNEGLRATSGEIIAFLDSDAYPAPEWPYHLALGFDRKDIVGVGGPNECPTTDGMRAQQIAAAPGGPIHVLLSDDRAEHVPGCNMAFTREALEALGGFDPIYTVAGDDVDFCWRVLDRDLQIAFHPAALVWHHPRSAIKAYLRQQWGYGASEALVQARHPDRFSMVGSARWRGRIYSAEPVRPWRERIYRGLYGAAPYQSIYRGGGELRDIAHQLGVPLAAAAVLSAPAALLAPALLAIPLLGMAFLLALGASDLARITVPLHARGSALQFRLSLTMLSLLQPVARAWGRARNRALARRNGINVRGIAGPIQNLGHGVFLMPDKRPRPELAENVMQLLRRAGMQVVPPTGWESYDALLLASALVGAELVSSAHPPGWLQLRIRRYLRLKPTLVAVSLIGVAALTDPRLTIALGIATLADIALGLWRTGPGLRRVLLRGAEPRRPKARMEL
jgi:glycosyltransferase involved in cell wall biosynthesis